MSTLRAATLSDPAGTGSPTITGGELSRARWSLNGTGVISLFDSFNIGSMTDNGVGDYSANFQIAMTNGTYTFSFGGQDGTNVVLGSGKIGTAPNASTLRFSTRSGANVDTDMGIITGLVVGDKP